LVDPSRQAANSGTATDWGNAWGTGGATTPATIGRSEVAPQLGNPAGNSGLVPVPPRYPSQQSSQQASNRWNDPWAEDDPWTQPQQQQGIAAPPPAAGIVSGTGQAAAANTGWQTDVATLPPAGANGTGSQPLISQAALPPNAAGFPSDGSQPGGNPAVANPGGNQQPNQGPPAGELPWVPLLVVSLSLVGSLSANLFLGWSYIDARQKYRSLVRKTADTFRRAAGAAAA
jgi:hypothetical protein